MEDSEGGWLVEDVLVVFNLDDDILILCPFQQFVIKLILPNVCQVADRRTQFRTAYFILTAHRVKEQPPNIVLPSAINIVNDIVTVHLRQPFSRLSLSLHGRGLPARYGQSVVVDLVVHGPFNVVLTGLRLLQPEQSNFRQVDTVPYAKEGRMEELIEKVFSLSSQ